MPFITEELWGSLTKRETALIHTDWPSYSSTLIDAAADKEMNWVIGLIEEIRSVRAQMHVPAGAKVNLLVSALDAAGQDAWERNQALIMRLARVETLSAVDTFPKGCANISVSGGDFGLPLADLIDIGPETANISNGLSSISKIIQNLFKARRGKWLKKLVRILPCVKRKRPN